MCTKMIVAGMVVLGASIFAQPTTVQAASRRYEIVWKVDPIAPSLEERTVKPGDVIARARLVPPTLLAIESDAVGDNANIVMPRGTQLIALRAGVRSACTFTFAPANVLQGFMRGNQRFTCFVDEDNDGKFETTFHVASNNIGVPSSFGAIPRTRSLITPVAYRPLSPSDAVGVPMLLFKYSHQDKITGHSYFGICLENASTHKQPCFDGYSGVRSDKLPKEIGAMGNDAIATEKQGDRITLVVRSGFLPMLFTAEEIVRLTFY